MLLVLSAVFESLPPQARRRAADMIADTADIIDDEDAQRLMGTFRARK
jgi:hypothetical protein